MSLQKNKAMIDKRIPKKKKMLETYWQLFLAFFIPNIVDYGGGPAIIPLIEAEVVNNYGWLSVQQFSETLALGHALPSPIATKMALLSFKFIASSYSQTGWEQSAFLIIVAYICLQRLTLHPV